MKHIFFIDPIEKLVPKKDSSILMAQTAKLCGIEAYFVFEKDFYICTEQNLSMKVYEFDCILDENFYIREFSLGREVQLEIDSQVTIHMRIDPPYDSRYQRYLWMLDFLKGRGTKIKNDPIGIMKHNEKLTAYKRSGTLSTFVGASKNKALSYLDDLRSNGVDQYIFKPLDLYQGIGVKKVTQTDDIEKEIDDSLALFKGPIVIQPFVKEVQDGEIRSIFYRSREIGSILKVPPKGDFLANIARGATYHSHSLSEPLLKECQLICDELLKDGIELVAFDILADRVSEVNVTCPGLMVEVSSAKGENLAKYLFT